MLLLTHALVASGRPHAVVTDVVVVAVDEDVVGCAASDAPGAVLAVGAPRTLARPHSAQPEVEPVLGRILPLAGTL